MAPRLKAITPATRAYRIADSRYPLFGGQGAALYGARWNSPGRAVIYAAETYSGALLECLAHANIGTTPRHQAWIQIEIPAGISSETVVPLALEGWDDESFLVSRAFGDEWFDSKRSCLLYVPSVVTRVERNVLINTGHPQFGRLSASKAQPVSWDERLLKKTKTP